MDQVAERAGIARAKPYQHFRSRLELVDAICETFAASPALTAIREAVRNADPAVAFQRVIEQAVRFWSDGDRAFAQLYGVAAIDPAATGFIARQREDRRSKLKYLCRRLHADKQLRDGVTPASATTSLTILTSYGTYQELKAIGAGEHQMTQTLLDAAQRLILKRAATAEGAEPDPQRPPPTDGRP